jgi:hypothetical protein
MNAMTTQPASRIALERMLCRDGYVSGLPLHVAESTVRTDKAACRRLRCPGCDRRGLEHRLWRPGMRYRVLATCPTCASAEEV